MAWAQNLLGFCLFACASQTPFSWVWSGGLQASKSYVAQRFALLEATFFFFLFLVGSKCNVFFLMAFFRLRFRNGLGTKPAGVLPFRMRVPNTFFLSLAWWLAGFQVLRCAKVCLAWGDFFSLFLVGSKSNVSAVFWLRFRMVWALYFFLFSGFQKRRFGIFPAAVSQWLGHKTCWGSAFSHARPKHLFLEFGLVACRLPSLTLRKGLPCLRQPFFLFLVGSKCNVSAFLFLMGSNSDVSAFFRLRFCNGLGTKPAGVLPFRMRVPNTFFLSLAWWLAGFQVLRCAKVCLAWGNLFFCF